MLFEKNFSKAFWVEAVNTSIYLLNMLPTKALKELTPFEAWHQKKPSLEHVRVFACVSYTHVPDVKRSKLDHKSQIGIFLGYSSCSKGYQTYNLETK